MIPCSKISVTTEGLSILQRFAEEVSQKEETISKSLRTIEGKYNKKAKQKIMVVNSTIKEIDSFKELENKPSRRPRASLMYALPGYTARRSINNQERSREPSLSETVDQSSNTNLEKTSPYANNKISSRGVNNESNFFRLSTYRSTTQLREVQEMLLKKQIEERKISAIEKKKYRLQQHNEKYTSCIKSVKRMAIKKLEKKIDYSIFMEEITKVKKDIESKRMKHFSETPAKQMVKIREFEIALAGRGLNSSPRSDLLASQISCKTPTKKGVFSFSKSKLSDTKIKYL